MEINEAVTISNCNYDSVCKTFNILDYQISDPDSSSDIGLDTSGARFRSQIQTMGARQQLTAHFLEASIQNMTQILISLQVRFKQCLSNTQASCELLRHV